MTLSSDMLALQSRINSALTQHFKELEDKHLHSYHVSSTLIPAMHYGVMNGGKRIRPLLCYASATLFNVPYDDNLDQIAMAIELIHSYSLIHDDLPSMDDDDLRRGQPSCHKKFNEALAILAGDALQAEAFNLLSRLSIDPATKIKLIDCLSDASSALGLVGGQTLDIESTNKSISIDLLQTIHQLKTGKLISASVAMGAIYAQADDQALDKLRIFSEAIGLAFQIQDDILDLEGTTSELGKHTGMDVALNKATYPNIINIDNTKSLLLTLLDQSHSALSYFDHNIELLQSITDYVIYRNH
jgi:farnesyl diphosphate synthase